MIFGKFSSQISWPMKELFGTLAAFFSRFFFIFLQKYLSKTHLSDILTLFAILQWFAWQLAMVTHDHQHWEHMCLWVWSFFFAFFSKFSKNPQNLSVFKNSNGHWIQKCLKRIKNTFLPKKMTPGCPNFGLFSAFLKKTVFYGVFFKKNTVFCFF